MSTIVDALKQAIERASQQSSEEQEALAAILMQAMDDDARWEALFADPLTPQALDLLAAEAIAEDDAGQAEEITGEGFLS
ncbi:MAG TPA: hypothetical protein VH591_08155 [Ktedonobacterales bacterium]|jgi:hypothetical protein